MYDTMFLTNLNALITTHIPDIWEYLLAGVTDHVSWVSNIYWQLRWIKDYMWVCLEFIPQHLQYKINHYITSLEPLYSQMPLWFENASFQAVQYYSMHANVIELPVIQKMLITKLVTYNFVLIWNVLKYGLFVYFCYYIVVYSYFNTNILNAVQTSLLLKFLHTVDSEEELGSLDDLFTLIFLFIVVFGWFFGLTLCFSYLFKTQFTLFGVGVILLILFILLTPLSTLIDFGISFTTYIRGASSSSNLLVECIFDVIGTLVVFTRFVVQNIRFVLIFFAYFELFEWTYNNSLTHIFLNITNFNTNNVLNNIFTNLTIDFTNIFLFLSIIVTSVVSYLYYLVHLLILIFVQVTIYLLISFWLFFFFYTSFTLSKNEKLFIMKK